MTEEEARKELFDYIQRDNSLYHQTNYISWQPSGGENACLDGYFTYEELEAIAWWMRNKKTITP